MRKSKSNDTIMAHVGLKIKGDNEILVDMVQRAKEVGLPYTCMVEACAEFAWDNFPEEVLVLARLKNKELEDRMAGNRNLSKEYQRLVLENALLRKKLNGVE